MRGKSDAPIGASIAASAVIVLTAAGMNCAFGNDIDHKTSGTDFNIFPMEHYCSAKDAAGEALERSKVLLAKEATASPSCALRPSTAPGSAAQS